MNEITTLWEQHQTLITVIGVVLAGIVVTSVAVWILRKIVRPIIAIATGMAATAVTAVVSGFVTDATAAASTWVNGG